MMGGGGGSIDGRSCRPVARGDAARILPLSVAVALKNILLFVVHVAILLRFCCVWRLDGWINLFPMATSEATWLRKSYNVLYIFFGIFNCTMHSNMAVMVFACALARNNHYNMHAK